MAWPHPRAWRLVMAWIIARHGTTLLPLLSNAFNVGYDMVSAWDGRTPNIGEAFIQSTLFALRARPPFHVCGPSFPRPIAPTPAGPGHGCANCGHNLSFAAQSGPSVPPSVSPGHPGASGVNMPGAPRQPAPSATVNPPPGFGTLGSPPVANTTRDFLLCLLLRLVFRSTRR